MRPTNRYSQNRSVDPLASKYKRNDFITAPEVRLINADGEPEGIVPLQKALEMAKELDLDLVEVAPNATPPVCKIISWSKFKYDQSKKTKTTGVKTQMKEIRLGALIGENDRDHKTKRIKEFLMDKHLVRITVRTPGRIRMEQSFSVMNKIIDDIFEYGELEGTVKQEGHSVVATVKPLKVKRTKVVEEEES